MKDWKTLKRELLKDKQVAKEYKSLAPKYAVISQFIELRRRSGITQAELAERIGTKQSAIARFEAGNVNPSLSFLQRIASSLGCELAIKIK